VTGHDLEKLVPILTGRRLDTLVAFYERLGLRVTSDWDDYVILEDPGGVELHLSRSAEHDPYTTAGVVYLRVRDAQALFQRLRDELAAEDRLYLAPASGITDAHTTELRAMDAAGADYLRLHQIESKPWGMLQFGIVDPEGNLVQVGSPTG
jgi:hypothetical protein